MAFTPICVQCAREMRCRKNGYFFKDYQGAAIWSGDNVRVLELPGPKLSLASDARRSCSTTTPISSAPRRTPALS
jgi:hypothetical protein